MHPTSPHPHAPQWGEPQSGGAGGWSLFHPGLRLGGGSLFHWGWVVAPPGLRLAHARGVGVETVYLTVCWGWVTVRAGGGQCSMGSCSSRLRSDPWVGWDSGRGCVGAEWGGRCGAGEMFRLHDCALLNPDKESDQPYVLRIEDMWQVRLTSTAHSMAYVAMCHARFLSPLVTRA